MDSSTRRASEDKRPKKNLAAPRQPAGQMLIINAIAKHTARNVSIKQKQSQAETYLRLPPTSLALTRSLHLSGASTLARSPTLRGTAGGGAEDSSVCVGWFVCSSFQSLIIQPIPVFPQKPGQVCSAGPSGPFARSRGTVGRPGKPSRAPYPETFGYLPFPLL